MADSGTSAGAAVYNALFLRFVYDHLVLGFYCSFVWRCSSRKLRSFYGLKVAGAGDRSSTSKGPDLSGSTTKLRLPPASRLLDCGVGTGYFLEHAPIAGSSEVVLADLNPACLDAARLRTVSTHSGISCEIVKADFLSDDPIEGLTLERVGGTKFDVISVMLLLHCLPGPSSRKAKGLVRLRHLLGDRGVLVGSTVLGRGVRHNALGKFIMFWHNLLGIFDNYTDDVAGFVEPLEGAFQTVKWELCGAMLLFEASGPKA
ncbi:hypothetical protein VTL71DRAFT_10124 [Oculimacula yallundae]|uniref:Methyltransferase domain-containing protein n=1 Tax=Oculimacula yallundae TaxID=86028 RepID=A0ABR4BQG1_9HELO